MKTLLSIAGIFFMVTAFAQTRVGFEAGYSRAGFNENNEKSPDYSRTTSPITTGQAGLVSFVPVSRRFFLQPSLLLTGKGSHKKEGGGFSGFYSETDLRLWYAELPVNILYSFVQIKNLRLLAGAGAYISMGIWGKSKGFRNSHDSLGMPGIYEGVSKVKFTNDLYGYHDGKTNVKPIDAGANGLLQAELKNVFLKISYSYGITKVINPGYKNRVFALSAGCFFGSSKKR